MLNDQNIVIVAGHYGSGKTAIVRHIALKYRKHDWTVKPVNAVEEIKLTYASRYLSRKKTLFVFNDPIGKESLDEVSCNSWRKCEETLQYFQPNVKLLITCKTCFLTNTNVPDVFKKIPNVIIIDDNENRLNNDEKRQILKKHNTLRAFSETDIREMVKINTYFPLLCKLSADTQKHSEGSLTFFNKLIEVLLEEIKNLRFSNKEAYCGLVCLVVFNDKLSSHDLEENEKQFKQCLNICGLSPFTLPATIIENLEMCKDIFVKKIGDAYHFYNVFVMEAAVVTFGPDFPAYAIKYADLRILRRRLRFENCVDLTDSFMITLNDNYIGNVADRFIQEMFENRFMDVVLNPCLRNTKIVNDLIRKLEEDRKKLALMVRQIEPERFILEPWDVKNKQWSSRLNFVTMGRKTISPLFALIAFCHDEISSFCLKELKKATKEFSNKGILLLAVCFNGSKNMCSMFSKNDMNHCFQKKWGYLDPINILSLFHNHELLQDMLTLKRYRNLVNKNEGITQSLPLALECNSEQSIEIDSQQIQSSRYKTIEVLLKNGYNVNCFAKNGDTPLCMAAKHVDENIAVLLLDHGAEVNLSNRRGESPLSIACENGNVRTVELFLKRGANVNVCNFNTVNPLYNASHNGKDSIVRLLLQKGAKIDLVDRFGNSPLSGACQNGHDRIVELLLSHGAHIDLYNTNKVTPLLKACKNGHEKTVQILLQKGANIDLCDNDGNSPLSGACENGHDMTVELLLNHGAHIDPYNINEVSPLFKVCENRREGTVKLLPQKGVDMNLCDIYGNRPLSETCENVNYSTVELSLNHGAHVDQQKSYKVSPLFKACENGHIRIVQLLLQKGADVNLCDKYGNSPLSGACENGHQRACENEYYGIVQHLLNNGANVNLSNNEKETPLFKACEIGYDNTVQLLLKKGADVNLCETNGISPLSTACEKGYCKIVHLLLENGANVNSCDKGGFSPLYIACEYGHYDIVKVLLENGADVNLCDEKGISPLDKACEKEQFNIIQLLRNDTR